jgi:HD-GYP domain-containing protein (c-di-GMP phosphodiesterase class II)
LTLTDELAGFAAVRRWLIARDGEEGIGRVYLDNFGNVTIQRPRARVVVMPPGGEVPDRFDVLLLAGPANILASALVQMNTPRMQLLSLPTPPLVADKVVIEAIRMAEAVAGARVADQLVEIGTALSAERDPGRVLELILQHGRAIARADAGSMFVVEGDGDHLRFAAAHNDSVDVDFSTFTMPVAETSIAGTAVLSGRTVRVADLYASGEAQTHDRTFQHDRTLDRSLGYQTRSMLTTPVITPEGQVLAVMQLINARDDDAGPLRSDYDFETRVRPFTPEDERLCVALASQAAVALENAQLIADIEALFEGFVRASVHAIEQRDPTTSGHSQRVADLTVGLAKAADRDDTVFEAVQFDAASLREIEYAGLLHDFGKVGVREEVLVKAKKLYPHRRDLLQERFCHMRTALQRDVLQAQADGEDPSPHHERLAALVHAQALVDRSNEPSVLAEETSAELPGLLELAFVNGEGRVVRVVDPEDVAALGVRRGSLTPEERREIEDHVRHTYDFLVRIPWTKGLSRIPEIAGKHHEYLDGSGYPEQLGAPAIPIQARMMTVADIFDALTASDRPYKTAVPLERALDILHAEVKRGKVDAEVLALFIEAKVWKAVL